MGYKVLYRKYRPSDFDNVVGQDVTIKMLKNSLINNKHSHAYIFTGPRGTGKTSTARLFAKALNCMNLKDGNPCNECEACISFNESPDIIEIDAASNNGVDEIRELINNVKILPTSFKYKVYIIDEVHMLSTSAFNALLLTLEEPPEHVVFILATTDIQNVPITILSRCQRFDFKKITNRAIFDRLKFVCDKENIEYEEDALSEISIMSNGGMRDALGMLDQISAENSKVKKDNVVEYFGSISIEKVDRLFNFFLGNKIKEMIDLLNEFKNDGISCSILINKLIDIIRNKCIDIKLSTSNDVSFEKLYCLIKELNECLTSGSAINVDGYVLVEMALLHNISSSNTEKYFPGNNNDVINNDEGNKNIDVKVKEKKDNISIDVDMRINNCFYNATKDDKNKVNNSWMDFINYLVKEDRNIISLLADVSVKAASDKYIIISSSIDSTNKLINKDISSIEKYYNKFTNCNYRFVAVDEKKWKKEVEKYRFNLKNNIKYEYIDEGLDIELNDSTLNIKSDSLEDVGKEMFGSLLEINE